METAIATARKALGMYKERSENKIVDSNAVLLTTP